MPKSGATSNPELSRLVAARLRRIRVKAQLEVQDMVRRTGISRSGINKMEDPELSNPTVSYLAKYLAACDMTLFEFFDTEPWIPSSSRETHAVRTFKRLLEDQERKNDILTFLAILEHR